MLEAASREGVHWLIHVPQVTWPSGKAPKDWQTVVISVPSKNILH